MRLPSRLKGVLGLSLGQESYGSKPGPFAFHISGGRLNCKFEFSSRHRFHQWWEVRRQDPDSSYIELYRHTTCPEAMEKKQRTSLSTKKVLQETQPQHRLSACFKIVVVYNINGNKWLLPKEPWFLLQNAMATNFSLIFLQDYPGHLKQNFFFLVSHLYSASITQVQMEEIPSIFKWKVQIFRSCIWYGKSKCNSNASA